MQVRFEKVFPFVQIYLSFHSSVPSGHDLIIFSQTSPIQQCWGLQIAFDLNRSQIDLTYWCEFKVYRIVFCVMPHENLVQVHILTDSSRSGVNSSNIGIALYFRFENCSISFVCLLLKRFRSHYSWNGTKKLSLVRCCKIQDVARSPVWFLCR